MFVLGMEPSENVEEVMKEQIVGFAVVYRSGKSPLRVCGIGRTVGGAWDEADRWSRMSHRMIVVPCPESVFSALLRRSGSGPFTFGHVIVDGRTVLVSEVEKP